MTPEELSKIKVLRQLYKNDFYAFCRRAFQFYRAGRFVEHWSLQYVCEWMQLTMERKVDWLVINLPRGWGKSIVVSELAPAWLLLRDATERIACYSKTFEGDPILWHDKTNKILQSPFTQTFFPEMEFDYKRDLTITPKGGFRRVKSTNTNSVGSDLTFLLADDMEGESNVFSEKGKQKIKYWFAAGILPALRMVKYSSLLTEEYKKQLTEEQKARLEKLLAKDDFELPQKQKAGAIFTQQRLFVDDATSMIDKTARAVMKASPNFKYERISIPAIAEEDILYKFPISGQEYFRKKEEYLIHSTLNQEEIDRKRTALPVAVFQAHYQQSPIPLEGTIIKREALKNFELSKAPPFERYILSVDCAATATRTADYSACLVFGVHNNKAYLVEIMRERLEFSGLLLAITKLYETYNTNANALMLIEKASAGEQMLQLFKHTGIKALAIKATMNKYQRLQQASPFINTQERLFIPVEDIKHKGEFLSELLNFTGDRQKHDDMVDALSQFINNFERMNAPPKSQADILSEILRKF